MCLPLTEQIVQEWAAMPYTYRQTCMLVSPKEYLILQDLGWDLPDIIEDEVDKELIRQRGYSAR